MADSLRFREDLVARGTRSLFIRFFSLWTVRELLFRTTRRSLPGVVLLERVQLARGDPIGLDGVRLSEVGDKSNPSIRHFISISWHRSQSLISPSPSARARPGAGWP